MKKIRFIFILCFFYTACTMNSSNQLTMNSIKWFEAGETLAEGKASLGYAGPSVGVNSDVLIFVGGANFPDKLPWYGGLKKYYDLVQIYKKNENGTLKWYQTKHFPKNLAYAAACSTSNGMVIAGGENENGPSDEVYLLNWKNDSLLTTSLPKLPYKASNAQMTHVDDKVYYAGGEDATKVHDELLSLDLSNLENGWQLITHLPQATSSGVLVQNQIDGNTDLFLVGGRKKQAGGLTTFYNQVFAYDIQNNKWKVKASMPNPLAAGTGIAYGDVILMFSGDQGLTFNKTEALINLIAKALDPVKKEDLIKEKIQLQESHPGFVGDVLQYVCSKNEWQSLKSSPFPGQVTTQAILWDQFVYIPNGEIRAGVRSPKIIAGKIDNK